MIKKFFCIVMAVFLMVMSFVLPAFAKYDTSDISGGEKVMAYDYSSYKPAKDNYTLVFIPKLVHTWYEAVKAGIDKAVAELATRGVKVNIVWDAPADAVVTEQIAKMEADAATMPDGMSIALIDPASETTVINELIAAGIKVSTFDNDAADSNRLFYCGHAANFVDGEAMAKMLAEQIGGKGQVAILAGTLSAINHKERVDGFKDYLAKNYPEITIVDEQPDNDSIEEALKVTEGYISTYPDLKGIFGCNGASPNGAARAVKDAGKAGKICIVGMAEDREGADYIIDGTIYATNKQKVSDYGYYSVYNMIMIADGKEPVAVYGNLPTDIVTAENVKNFEWN